MNTRFVSRFDSPRRRARRALLGLSVVGIGCLALLDNLQVFATPLLRTFWPLVFVAWGIARLAWPRREASRWFGAVLVVAGVLMTAHNLGHGQLDLRQWWPVFVILAGVAIVLRGVLPSSRSGGRGSVRGAESSMLEHGERVDIDTSFSGIQVQNDSRSFKGGRIAVNFGGLELDLRQAVMDGPEATLEIDATFSGIELRVPRDWQVAVQMTARMGAVDDKTVPPATPGHRLVLRGETLFGGIEVKN